MKNLIVNSDDFGMCHSVNMGVLQGFKTGILTQSTLMAPAPWFEEAVFLAKEHDIPVGVHLTTACDWDRFKYKPITGARSLVTDDGSFYNRVEDTAENGTSEEIEAELRAQIELVMARGITPTHIDVHMGIIDEELIVRLLREYGIHGRPPVNPDYSDCIYRFDTYGYGKRKYSSSMPSDQKKDALKRFLRELDHGFHFLCGHLAVASDEMKSVCKGGEHGWAQEYRISDLAAFTDPEIKNLINECDINLVSFRDVDINGDLC